MKLGVAALTATVLILAALDREKTAVAVAGIRGPKSSG
jgi:hypothetical protein